MADRPSSTPPTVAARVSAPVGRNDPLAEAMRLLGDHPDRAAELARGVLDRAPGHVRASIVLGCALRHGGKPAAAIAVLQPLAETLPDDGGIACELGLALLGAGQIEAAIEPLRRATMLRPRLTAAWAALARALRQSGRENEAWQADAGAVAAASAEPQLVEAARCLHTGHPARAESLIRAYLAALPDDAAAIRLLGELAWRTGHHDEAIAHLERAVALAPGFEAARVFLTRVLVEADRLEAALAQAVRLTGMAPDDAGLALLHASILTRLGRHDEARDIYRDLIARGVDEPPVWLNLGHVCKTLGLRDEAEQAWRSALARAPGLGEAWWSIANLKTAMLGPEDIAAMRAALAAGASGEDGFHLHFALGKAHEDARDHAAAFAAYDQANRLRRLALPYDAATTARQAEAHARLFTAAFFAGRGGWGHDTSDPIFVLGLPRAGSTLVEQILASHSSIEGTHELPAMMMIADRLRHRVRRGEAASFEALVAGLAADECRALGEDYAARARVHRSSDKPHFIDKMPNNWQHVGLIRLILPRARIIDARRHPMACCFSAWKQHFARGQAFSYDLADAGAYYRAYVGQMAAFDAAQPGAVHRVIHERLVADIEGEVRHLLAALDLPFEEACLTFWQNRRAVRTASAEQVRRPISSEGIDQWLRFASFLGPLETALGPVRENWQAEGDRQDLSGPETSPESAPLCQKEPR